MFVNSGPVPMRCGPRFYFGDVEFFMLGDIFSLSKGIIRNFGFLIVRKLKA